MFRINGIPVSSGGFVESVYEFNRIGGPRPPGHFDAERVCFYAGMMLEEQAEFIRGVMVGAVTLGDKEALSELATTLEAYGTAFKNQHFYGCVLRGDRKEMLDGSLDTAFVAVGAMVYQTPHFRQAIEHLLTKNAEKFPCGVALRDDNGKVLKPAGWTKPDLTPFIDTFGTDL